MVLTAWCLEWWRHRTDPAGLRRLLADDFRCIHTGPITKIFLWGSWLNDPGTGNPPGRLQHFRLGIFSDDPVGNGGNPNEDPENQHSKPLELLWSEVFSEGDFEAREFAIVPEERFWDPYGTEPLGYDNRIFEYRLAIPEDRAFQQQGSPGNPKIYWLAVSAELATGQSQWGWKTTDPEHGWNDQAAALTDRGWVPLTHPWRKR